MPHQQQKLCPFKNEELDEIKPSKVNFCEIKSVKFVALLICRLTQWLYNSLIPTIGFIFLLKKLIFIFQVNICSLPLPSEKNRSLWPEYVR